MTSPFESLDFYALLTLLAGMVLYHLSRRDPRETFAPPVVVAVVFFFYAVLAPRDAYLNGETQVFFLDALPFYPLAWRSVVVHLLGFLIGYHALGFLLPRFSASPPVSSRALARLGYTICLWTTIAYGLSQGFDFILRLNPLTARQAIGAAPPLVSLGVLSTYVAYTINFLILGVLFQFPAAIRFRSFRLNAIGWSAFAAAIYVTFGFRWRVALLFGGLFMLWYLWTGRRIRWGLLLLPIPLLVAGAMGVNRNYGAGLDVEAISGQGFDELIRPTLGEGRLVFNMTSLLINHVESTQGFVGVESPLLAVFTTILPRQFLPGKDIAQYLRDAFIDVFGDPIAGQAGLAVLNSGEYFLMAGWLGVFLFGLLFGYGARVLWLWYQVNRNDAFVASCYTIASVFVFLLISRGFLPGVFILAAFTFLPFVLFRRRLRVLLSSPSASVSGSR